MTAKVMVIEQQQKMWQTKPNLPTTEYWAKFYHKFTHETV